MSPVIADTYEPGTICGECGHGHEIDTPCADHSWTDGCPYVGLDCPPQAERERVTAELDAAYESLDEPPPEQQASSP